MPSVFIVVETGNQRQACKAMIARMEIPGSNAFEASTALLGWSSRTAGTATPNDRRRRRSRSTHACAKDAICIEVSRFGRMAVE
jgi:hypothetical protein